MSEVFQNAVIDHLEAILGSVIRVANGYYYDVFPENIHDIKVDLATDGSGPLRLAVYSSGSDCDSPGVNAAYGQVHKKIGFHVDLCLAIDTSTEREINRALADVEKCITKDISQGGTCLKTFTRSCQKFGMDSANNFHATYSFDVLMRHAANDPSAEYQTTYN